MNKIKFTATIAIISAIFADFQHFPATDAEDKTDFFPRFCINPTENASSPHVPEREQEFPMLSINVSVGSTTSAFTELPST